MKRLSLTYTDAQGGEHTVPAASETFTVGRLSTCDLSIADGRLSREHCRIDRTGDDIFVADLGSSNGTKLNSGDLSYRTRLYDGDVLDMGGLIFRVRIEEVPDEKPAETAAEAVPSSPSAGPPPASGATAKSGSGGFPWIFIIAPVVAVIVLAFAGGIFLFVNSGSGSSRANSSGGDRDELEDLFNKRRSDDIKPGSSPTPGDVKPTATATPSGGASPTPTPGTPPSTPTADLSETAKVEQNAAFFMRKIGDNDPKAFLTSEQAKIVGQKIRQISGNPALAANLASARQQSSRISSLVASHKTKPLFLAVAAVNRLGSNRGDVARTAETTLPVIEKLIPQIGTESADDAILIIAAFEQGTAGDLLKMRNLLQDLANKFPASSREIRSIWFLKKQQRISDADFDRALTFLAIGTISQNPKDFGVNAEKLEL